jgi:hypothetical protein
MFSKVSFVVTDCADDDAVKGFGAIGSIRASDRKYVVSSSSPFAGFRKHVGRCVLGELEKFGPFEGAVEGLMANIDYKRELITIDLVTNLEGLEGMGLKVREWVVF